MSIKNLSGIIHLHILKQRTTLISRLAKASTINPERIKYFEKIAKIWTNPKGNFSAIHSHMSQRMEFIIKSLENIIKTSDKSNGKVLDGVKVLDVGCGVGLITEKLASLGADVTGIDPTAAVIEIAKTQLMTSPTVKSLNVRYLISTPGEHLKENNGKYDVLIVFLVLTHIQNHQQFLNDCYALLKPGGSILIQNGDKTWRNGIKVWWYTRITKIAPKKIILYSALLNIEDLTVLLRNAGFKIRDIKRLNFNMRGDRAYWTNSPPLFHFIRAIRND
ncbi:Hexaprenyldihydroxybenzoate methyltransferase, mitochondrial [Chamberlinius hualienensis]